LEFKRDFDFRSARTRRGRENRGFANIAGAQVQHDGTRRDRRIIALPTDGKACRGAWPELPMIAATIAMLGDPRGIMTPSRRRLHGARKKIHA